MGTYVEALETELASVLHGRPERIAAVKAELARARAEQAKAAKVKPAKVKGEPSPGPAVFAH